jgi:hypothetical protein
MFALDSPKRDLIISRTTHLLVNSVSVRVQGFGFGSTWIRDVFGSWIRIRIGVKIQDCRGSKFSRGRSKWRHKGSKWRPGGSVDQWSQIRIILMRSLDEEHDLDPHLNENLDLDPDLDPDP